MNKKRDLDVIGILLGVIIGVLIGYFISTRIKSNDQPVMGGVDNIEEVGYVYLLQLAKFDNAQGALNFVEKAKNKDVYMEVVSEGEFYYIYGAIAKSEAELELKKVELVAKGYECIIRKEYILNRANRVIDEEDKYEFWSEGINNLLNDLEGKDITISSKYYDKPIDLLFFSTLTILQTIQNDEIKDKLRLQAFRIICENLK